MVRHYDKGPYCPTMTRWSGFEFPANDAYDVRAREDRSPIGGACSDEVYRRFGPNRIESTKVLMRGHDRERRRVCDTLIHGHVASKEVLACGHARRARLERDAAVARGAAGDRRVAAADYGGNTTRR
jgi:hypothetical protein